MRANGGQETQCYTWNGHGNLGDDWIGEVAVQYFDRVVPVAEKRILNPLRGGGHRIKREDGKSLDGPLVLWGGGWIAADRPKSRTIPAWARHFKSQISTVYGIGVGIGPFTNTAPKLQADIASFFEAIGDRISVRTFADLKHLPKGQTAHVGSDIALLDDRFFDADQYLGEDSDYVIFSFPAYSAHWLMDRPWMSEEWYLTKVGLLAEQAVRGHRIIFVEFDKRVGLTSDSAYWSHLPGIVARPRNIEEAAELFRKAQRVYAGRLHAAILGAVLGVPTLALAYHHKFEVVSELGIATAGLTEEPELFPHPASADRHALAIVRQRGTEAIANFRW